MYSGEGRCVLGAVYFYLASVGHGKMRYLIDLTLYGFKLDVGVFIIVMNRKGQAQMYRNHFAALSEEENNTYGPVFPLSR